MFPDGGEVTSAEEPAHAGEASARHRTNTARQPWRMAFLLELFPLVIADPL